MGIRMDPLRIDRYGTAYLSRHLVRKNRLEDLFNLSTSRKWRRISERSNPSGRLYKDDIETAFQAFLTSIEIDRNDSNLYPISRLAALAWISSKLGREAGRLTTRVLEAIAYTQGVQQAVDRAAAIPDPNEQAEGLVWIGFGAHQLGNKQRALEIWDQAYQLLAAQQFDYWLEHLEIIGELINTAALAGDRQNAHEWYQKFAQLALDAIERTGGITSTVRLAQIKAALAAGQVESAVLILNQIDDIKDRGEAFLQGVEFQQTLPSVQDAPLISHYETFSHPEIDQPQLAAVFAGAGRLERARGLLKGSTSIINESWLLRSYISFLIKHGQIKEAQSYIQQVIALIQTLPNPLDRFQHCASFILGRQRDTISSAFTGLLPAMQNDYDEVSNQLDSYYVELAALAFYLLDDSVRAESALELYSADSLLMEDWEETNTLIQFATVLGETQDKKRIDQIFEIALSRQDQWHTAEILLALSIHASSPYIDQIMETLWKDQTAQEKRPNMIGALATWRYHQTQDQKELQTTLSKAIDMLKTSGDRADGLAYLALTLARNGLESQVSSIVVEVFADLNNEIDENTLARVSGTMADVAVETNDLKILRKLETIAEKIQDEPWLQGEALFWIASAYARLDHQERAISLFNQAMILASWVEIEEETISHSWRSQADAENFLDATNQIGWRSTQTAAIFAWIAILVINPAQWHTEIGLSFIKQMPEEYSEKRAASIQLLAKGLSSISNDPNALVELYTNGLRFSRQRDTGEVWAVIGACFNSLVFHFGIDFTDLLWDSMSASQAIFD